MRISLAYSISHPGEGVKRYGDFRGPKNQHPQRVLVGWLFKICPVRQIGNDSSKMCFIVIEMIAKRFYIDMVIPIFLLI